MARTRKGSLDPVVEELTQQITASSELRRIILQAVAEDEVASRDPAVYAASVSLTLQPLLRRLAREWIATAERDAARQGLSPRRHLGELLGISRQSVESALDLRTPVDALPEA